MTINNPADVKAIQHIIDTWKAALASKKIDEIMASYEKDVIAFDAHPDLRIKGADAYKAHWQKCVTECPATSLEQEIHEVKITTSDELAFSHFLMWAGATMPDGSKASCWMRITSCYQKIEGTWRIMHEHSSVPVNFETGQARLDAKP